MRGDLMRGRHRVSKLLLLHGCVYLDGRAWTNDATVFEQACKHLANEAL